MINQVFLTLPVSDLPRSVAFFKALGFQHNLEFSDDAAACIVIDDSTSVMLGTHEKFRSFTPKAVCDTSQSVEVLISLSCDSRDRVDELVAMALAAGGTTYDQPEDAGFMYSHSFVDPDGHGWGVLHMSKVSEVTRSFEMLFEQPRSIGLGIVQQAGSAVWRCGLTANDHQGIEALVVVASGE